MGDGATIAGWQLSAEQLDAGLRALKAVALANGVFDEEERHVIEAAAHAFGAEVDPDALAPIEPAEVARVFEDPTMRERVVQAMIVMAVIDGEASPEEIAVVDRFAAALEVADPRVKNLHQLLAGRVGFVRFDLFRRAVLPRMLVRTAYEQGGVKRAYKVVKALVKGAGDPDPELAWRYKQLGLLPDGTLGREFWKHMTREKFGFPGEPGGLDELGVPHDMTHVLCGYGTDPDGETQIASFYAGFFKEDPFGLVWMVLLMFHLGVKLAPVATPGKGHFDPEKVIRAMKRGARLNTDLTRHWNYWEVVELPIDEVRRRYGILEA